MSHGRHLFSYTCTPFTVACLVIICELLQTSSSRRFLFPHMWQTSSDGTTSLTPMISFFNMVPQTFKGILFFSVDKRLYGGAILSADRELYAGAILSSDKRL